MTSSLMATYTRHDVAFERGDGAYLYATDGRRFLDFAAGVAVNVLGHCHPHLVAALKAQARKLWHCSNLFRVPEQERLAARLAACSFADQVFFCNSGAEAVEGALKLVRKFHDMDGRPERYRVITFEGAFHGRTLATIAAGGSPKALAGFDPPMEGFDHVPVGDFDRLKATIGDTTAAILIEPVQGEGGVRIVPADFLRALRALADEAGILLVFDEVQCGMGRTGRLFAHEEAGFAPDIRALAKGRGGGFPIGAGLATARVAAAFQPGSHGSTFGGNPLACAVANAVLDVLLAPDFLPHVTAMGARLRRGLAVLVARWPTVFSEVRGAGLMLGLKCRVANSDVVRHLLDDGLLSVPASDNVVRLLPPLIIGEREIDEALEIINESCSKLAERAA
jgi:acetylornithine/N-succinyldiaminopimelate aminotransferase